MDEHRIDEAKGRVKEAAGDLTGDPDLQREGEVDQAGAEVKGAFERMRKKANDLVDSLKARLAKK